MGLPGTGKSTFLRQVTFINNQMLKSLCTRTLRDTIDRTLLLYRDLECVKNGTKENLPMNLSYLFSIIDSMQQSSYNYIPSLEDTIYLYHPTHTLHGYPVKMDYDEFILSELFDFDENINSGHFSRQGHFVFFCSVLQNLKASRDFFSYTLQSLGFNSQQETISIVFTGYDILESELELTSSFDMGGDMISTVQEAQDKVEEYFSEVYQNRQFSHINLLDRNLVLYLMNDILEATSS